MYKIIKFWDVVFKLKKGSKWASNFTPPTEKYKESKQCSVCKRTLPNKDFLTNDGCRWCDSSYAHKKIG